MKMFEIEFKLRIVAEGGGRQTESLHQRESQESSHGAFFEKMSQTRPLFVHFCPFLNTMTNIVQNLTIKV